MTDFNDINSVLRRWDQVDPEEGEEPSARELADTLRSAIAHISKLEAVKEAANAIEASAIVRFDVSRGSDNQVVVEVDPISLIALGSALYALDIP